MKKSQLIKRTYRISKKHDKIIKKHAKKVSESEVVRRAIDSINTVSINTNDADTN